jgi:hypothetical protein
MAWRGKRKGGGENDPSPLRLCLGKTASSEHKLGVGEMRSRGEKKI